MEEELLLCSGTEEKQTPEDCTVSSTNLLSKGWNQSLNPDNLAPKAMVLNNMPYRT